MLHCDASEASPLAFEFRDNILYQLNNNPTLYI